MTTQVWSPTNTMMDKIKNNGYSIIWVSRNYNALDKSNTTCITSVSSMNRVCILLVNWKRIEKDHAIVDISSTLHVTFVDFFHTKVKLCAYFVAIGHLVGLIVKFTSKRHVFQNHENMCWKSKKNHKMFTLKADSTNENIY